MSDLISRADAIEAVWRAITSDELVQGSVEEEILKLPSAEAVQETVPTVVRVTMSDGSQYYLEHESDAIQADTDDLIIKGAKGIQDGLYNIKDGKLFQYKAKGGTVRTYPIIKGGDDE